MTISLGSKDKSLLTKAERKAIEEQERQKYEKKKTAEKGAIIQLDSVQQYLPIKDIFQGIIITENDEYIKLLEFKPLNYAYMSVNEQNMVVDIFAGMLSSIPYPIQFTVISRKADVSKSIYSMKEHVESETNEACCIMQKDYINLLQDTALRDGVTRHYYVSIKFVPDGGNNGDDFYAIAADLESAAALCRSQLQKAGNVSIPLEDEKDEKLHSVLYAILCRKESETHPFEERRKIVDAKYASANVVVPAPEYISPKEINFMHHKYAVCDGKYYTFAYVPSRGYAREVVSGWVGLFSNAHEGIDVSITFEKIPRDQVFEKLAQATKFKRVQRNESANTDSNYVDLKKAVSANEYMLEQLSEGQDFYYATTLLTIVGDTEEEMEYRYRELEKRSNMSGFSLVRGTFHMDEMFKSVLPLCTVDRAIFRKARRNVLTEGAASFYPFTSYEMQDDDGIMIGVNSSNNSLVLVNPFDTASHSNANGAILGTSGSGKTFTASLLALRYRMKHIQTFIIAPVKGERDYKRGCDHIGGQFIGMGPGSTQYINIMDIRVPDNSSIDLLDDDASTTMNMSLLAQKTQAIQTFFHLIVRDYSQSEEQLLDGYIYKTYEKFGITEDNDSVYIPGTKEYKEMPLLEDLYSELLTDERMAHICNILTPYINGSMRSFNRHTNVDLNNYYIVFDLDRVSSDEMKSIYLFVVLDFCWSRIKENARESKAIFIDEVWRLISSKTSTQSAEYVKEIFKTIRAYNGSAFSMTQDITDFFSLNNGEYGKAIINNSETKIIMHLDQTELDTLSSVMTLTQNEYNSILKLNRGQGLVAAGHSKLFVDFRASKFEKSVITTDPKELNKLIEEKREEEELKELANVVDNEKIEIDFG